MNTSVYPVKVLYFVDRMRRGGIQTFVLENWRHMDHNKIQIDFLLLDDGTHYELENVLKIMGSNIYKLDGIWINTPKDFIRYKIALNNFFKEHHDYSAVHLHSSSKNYMVLEMAKKYGIKTRIAHSHNIGFQTKSKAKIFIGNIFKTFLKHYATDFFACSEEAGKWLFGEKPVTVIKNAVDTDKFRHSPDIALKMKKELGLENQKVIGHVGRFTHQKNHAFLIDIFNEVVKKDSTFRLLLIGEGELKENIQEKVNNLGLNDKVLFAGFKNNVEDYMQAMDYFVFPSEFEGLGLVLIEAQAAGLLCFTSDKVVPQEAKVSDLLRFIPLDNNPVLWAEQILSANCEKENTAQIIRQAGYDIKETALQLQEYYISHS